jgi:hypothetical protein
MTTVVRNPIVEFFRGKEKVSVPEGTCEAVKVSGPPEQPALAASEDTVRKSLLILDLGSDGEIRDDLRAPLIKGLKDLLANDKELQEAFGGQANMNTAAQIAVDILDLGIPFSVNQISASGNHQSLRQHLSSCPGRKVEPPDLWSTISDQSLKVILKNANTVINAELKKQDSSITEDLNLFRKEIDTLEHKINSAVESGTPSVRGLFGKALLLIGVQKETNRLYGIKVSRKPTPFENALTVAKLAAVGVVGGVGVAGVSELTGLIDYTPYGLSKGGTPPLTEQAKLTAPPPPSPQTPISLPSPSPAQLENRDLTKEITNFKARDFTGITEEDAQEKINVNFNSVTKGNPLSIPPNIKHLNYLF